MVLKVCVVVTTPAGVRNPTKISYLVSSDVSNARKRDKCTHRDAKKKRLKIELQEFPVVKSVSD